MSELELEITEQKPSRIKAIVLLFFVLLVGAIAIRFVTEPPSEFPVDTAITIEKGLTASEVVDVFKEQHVVRSSSLLYMVLIFLHNPSEIKAGEYVFSEPFTVFEVADKIFNTTPQATLISLTFPEGFSVAEFAKIAHKQLPAFDEEVFLALASTSEGFLFPETYFVPTNFTTEELFKLLSDTYKTETEPFHEKLTTDKFTEEGLIILASIVEREANTPESMRTVAGILHHRLVIGMPLQVDASMEYVIDKPLSELTPEDLKIDSPYNTYLYKGLPPTPIGNPGLTAIEAVIDPILTDNLYYITGDDGEFYYAQTYSEHKRNIARYLR